LRNWATNGGAVTTAFLEDVHVNDMLTTLAQADRVTIFVGAGSSMEVGLPSWSALIDRLLRRVALDRKLADPEQVQRFTDAVKREVDGVIAAATVIRTHFQNPTFRGDADAFIRKALYSDTRGDDLVPRFGPTARAVARLVPLWPLGSLEIITTNYDLLLEDALDDCFGHANTAGPPFGNLVGGFPARTDRQVVRRRFAVRHLHGALDPTADATRELTPVVIAESDYEQVQAEKSWQRRLLLRRLQNSVCVFVGASMTDVNVLRFLRLAANTPSAQPHVALLTRGARPGSPEIESVLRDAVRTRWAEYGVEALYPTFFIESSQFLEELGRRRRALNAGGAADPPGDRYAARLSRWEREIGAQQLVRAPDDALRTAQDQAHGALCAWLHEAKGLMPPRLRAELSRDTLGMQLWVVQDGGERLLLWATSTNSWRDASAFEAIPVELPSRWGAVEAYCAGSPVLREFPGDAGTRWRAALNVPVFLTDEPWQRLPVGVASLSAMDRQKDRLLPELKQNERDKLVALIEAAAAEYLTPLAPPTGRRSARATKRGKLGATP
jgi:hypothetical protein